MSTRKIATYRDGRKDLNVDVREITVKDQNKLVGAAVSKKTLVWSRANNFKVDVTDVHEDVLKYLTEEDGEFTITEVEVPDEEPKDEAPALPKSPRA